MEIKRNERFYKITLVLVGSLAGSYHNVKYSGEENIPKNGPVLLALKHQFYGDIVLEGCC